MTQVIAWLNKEVNENKLTPSTTATLNRTSTLPISSYTGPNLKVFPSSNFNTIQNSSNLHQFTTPQYHPTTKNASNYQSHFNTTYGDSKTNAPPYQARKQGFIPKVTPNPILKTPSKAPLNHSHLTKSESISDTQPRTYTPSAIKINR